MAVGQVPQMGGGNAGLGRGGRRKPNRGGGGGNRNRHPNRNTSPNENKGFSGVDSGGTLPEQTDDQYLDSYAEDQPLDYVTGQLTNAGEIAANGPNIYNNWLQNQFFNQLYGQYAGQTSPQTGFRSFVTAQGDMGPQARNQYLALTPSQRGQAYNPYSAGKSHFSWWT